MGNTQTLREVAQVVWLHLNARYLKKPQEANFALLLFSFDLGLTLMGHVAVLLEHYEQGNKLVTIKQARVIIVSSDSCSLQI